MSLDLIRALRFPVVGCCTAALMLFPVAASATVTVKVTNSGTSSSIVTCSAAPTLDSTPTIADCSSNASVAKGATSTAATTRAVYVASGWKMHLRRVSDGHVYAVYAGPRWLPIGQSSSATYQVYSSSTLLFADDFTGSAGQTFDHNKWQDWSGCTYNSTAYFGDIQCGDNETLDGLGHLQVPATSTTGSALATMGKFGFEYGTMSAWIENPAEDGYWPAFWSLNTANGQDTSPVGGEIDAMEGYTTWDTQFHRGVHNWAGDQTWGNTDDPTTCSNGQDLTTGFHKYSAKVEPGKITFSFDDQQCGQVLTSADGGGKPWAFGPDRSVSNFLLLDLAVGGAGDQQATPAHSATMLVDRVEVRGL